jgi:general secretion pathway protein D
MAAATLLAAQTPAPSVVPPSPAASLAAPSAALAAQSPGADQPEGNVPALSPPPPGTPLVLPETPKELATAKRLFRAGLKLKSSGKLDSAFQKFEQASELDPHSVEYLTAREFTRQELVMKALKRGNKAMLERNEIVAMAEFRQALEYDPTNDFALQRLHDSLPEQNEAISPGMRLIEQSAPLELHPAADHHDFHYRGDARTLLTQVAQAYGITAEFDDSVQQRRLHFDIDNVNFATAMEAANAVSKTFWVPLSAKQILIAADTAENRRRFERMTLRTFYLPEVVDPQLTQVANLLRVLLNIRYVSMDRSQSTISIRAEQPLVEAASRIVEGLTGPLPELLLDVRIYQISFTFLRQLGTAWPNQFTMFNISPALIAGLGSNAQNLINQLVASGGINQANSQAIQALLAQLANQSSSILQQPFATFGGGLTLTGLTTGGTGTTVKFNLQRGDIKTLDHVTLRASQNNAAVLHIGQRYPIVNATYAPIYNSSAISKVLGNQSYIAPFPSFNFEDLGINLKTTPAIHRDGAVTMKLELTIRSLGTQTVNGIPIINNREYNGSITANDGESSVIAGIISRADSRSINGYPWLGRVPALTYAASEHDKNVAEDELLVVITPRIVRMPEYSSVAVRLPAGQ